MDAIEQAFQAIRRGLKIQLPNDDQDPDYLIDLKWFRQGWEAGRREALDRPQQENKKDPHGNANGDWA